MVIHIQDEDISWILFLVLNKFVLAGNFVPFLHTKNRSENHVLRRFHNQIIYFLRNEPQGH